MILRTHKPKSVVVKAYRNRRQMERGIERMVAAGYEVQQQSGEFTRNPFVLSWNRRRVVVTFRLWSLNDGKAPPQPEG